MVQQVPSGQEDKQQAAEAVLRPGRIIQDKYLVHRIIGVGGMCAVGSATNVLLDQVIALKVLLPALAKNSEMVLRFMREARSAARLKSEHVARVFDVGMLESGEPYMVMEFLEGCDLGVVLDGRGAVPVQEAVEYVVQACEGIGEAHAMGIVHRDLKPENLFLARRADGVSRIKVLDFGIAKAMVPTESGQRPSYLTEETTTFGTPTYMSPEQLRESRDVDARSDIFSIGVILYELVSGRVPFEGDTTADLHASILMEEPSPLNELDPTVPEAFDAIVQRCLAKDRHERFSNVAELAEALLPFAPASMQDYGDRVSRVVTLSRSGDYEPHVDYSDVFLHEYTHYINHNAIGFSEAVYSIDEYGVITSPGTIDEGTADYFSSTVNDDPVVGEASLSTLGPYARDLEGDGGKCPDTMYGETHEDGKLIGTAAWAVRKALGADVADPLIWGAMSMLPKGTATLGDFAKNVMDAAQDLKTQGKMTDGQIATLQAIFDERGLSDCFRSLDISPTQTRKTNMIGLDLLGQMMGASCSSIRNYGVKMTSLFHFKYQPKPEDKAIRFKVSQKAIMGGGSDWKWTMYVRKGEMVTFNSNPMTMSTSVNEYDYEQKDIKTADGEIVIDDKSNPPFDPTQSYSMVIMHQNCPTALATVSVVADGAPPSEPQPEAGTEDAPPVEEDASTEPETEAGDPGVTDKGADDGGCGCRTARTDAPWGGLLGLGLAAAAIARVRRRR